ncbi:MAG TPA: methyltransferase domain-containing protein [Terriglobia bacterium]|nr:methyltransferase domain-containing protein [Terriglobia bacterium]
MIILDLGCGKIKQDPQEIGLDRERGSAANVICELKHFPWPLRDSCADKLYLSHFIEHQPDLLRVMAEVRRVAKPGAEVVIVTPHYSSHGSYTDPTHLFHLGFHSFDYFERESFENFTYNAGGFRIVHRELTFGKNFLLDNAGRMFARWSMEFYEKHLAWIFPARNIICRMKVVK